MAPGGIIANMVGAQANVVLGERSLAVGDWERARSAFEAALGEGDDPVAEDGLGRALWWLGDADGAIEHRERAFVLWREKGPPGAGRGAFWRPREPLPAQGNGAAPSGGPARADRVLGDAGPA